MTMIRFTPDKPETNALRDSATVRNNLNALFRGDLSPLRARAQTVPDMTVAIAGTNFEAFWSQTWVGLNLPLDFAGGNSPTITAPTANPRIDLLTINSAGVLSWTQGAESASPTPPNCPAEKIPICWIYCKTTMIKIVNFEDQSANPNEGYIYRDVRPFLNLGGGTGLIATNFQSFDKDLFGDGSDGDVTISVDTTLAAGADGVKVLRYNNLTINAGVYLEANAVVLVLLIKNKLTINGTIRMNGRGGAGGASGDPPQNGGVGAFGGGGGGSYTSDRYGGIGGGPGTGINTHPFQAGWGGGGSGGNVGPGGEGKIYLSILKNPLIFELAHPLYGGGGGGAGPNGGSGAGGAGGGGIWIEANEIEWGASGLISANGINGVNGTGYGSGGGGGAGGFIQVVYKTKTGTSNIEANGGVGGTGYYGSNGGNGADGISAEFQVK